MDRFIGTLIYDPQQRLSSVVHPQRGYTLGYEPVMVGQGGRLTTLTTTSGSETVTLTYAQPVTGTALKSMTWSGAIAGSVGWLYDQDFRMQTETVTVGATGYAATYGYDRDGLISGVTGPSGASYTVTRDPGNVKNGLLYTTTLSNTADIRSYTTYGELAS
jgi:hypothetical protein